MDWYEIIIDPVIPISDIGGLGLPVLSKSIGTLKRAETKEELLDYLKIHIDPDKYMYLMIRNIRDSSGNYETVDTILGT